MANAGSIAVGGTGIALIGTTFADWYVYTLTDSNIGRPLSFAPFAAADGSLARISTTPWTHSAPLAALLVAFVIGALFPFALTSANKMQERTAAAITALCALGPMAIILAQLMRSQTQHLLTVDLTIAYAPAFYIATGTAAALLVASAVNLWFATAATGRQVVV